VCKKLIKNSQPFGKKFQKTVGGIFFDSHCTFTFYLTLPSKVTSLEFKRSLLLTNYSDGARISITYLATLNQYWNATDRRTDRQTERNPIIITHSEQIRMRRAIKTDRTFGCFVGLMTGL